MEEAGKRNNGARVSAPVRMYTKKNCPIHAGKFAIVRKRESAEGGSDRQNEGLYHLYFIQKATG